MLNCSCHEGSFLILNLDLPCGDSHLLLSPVNVEKNLFLFSLQFSFMYELFPCSHLFFNFKVLAVKIVKVTSVTWRLFVIFIVQVQSSEKLLLYRFIQLFELIIVFENEIILNASVKSYF